MGMVNLVYRAPVDTTRKDKKTGMDVPSVNRGGIIATHGTSRLDSRRLRNATDGAILAHAFYGEDAAVKEMTNRKKAVNAAIQAAAAEKGIALDDERHNLDYILGKKAKDGSRKADDVVIGTVNVS